MNLEVYKRLKYFRTRNNLTQKDVAKHLDITRQAYNRYETNQREPGLEVIMKVCELYGITPTDIFYGVDETQLPIDYWNDFSFLAQLLDRKSFVLKDMGMYLHWRKQEQNPDYIYKDKKFNQITDEEAKRIRKEMEELYKDVEKYRNRIVELLKFKTLDELLDEWY